MIRRAVVIGFVMGSAWAADLAGQADSLFVAANGAGCRASPDASGGLVRRLSVGQVAAVSGAREGWALVSLDGVACWVAEALVVPHEPGGWDNSLILATTSMLDRQPAASATDFAVLGRLVEQRLGLLGQEASPLLQLQLLKLLDGAASARRGSADDWLAMHESVLGYYEPAAAYYVLRTAYQRLYQSHSSSAAAEVLAWAYFRNPPMRECETVVNCRLDQVLQSVAEYWRLFPDGPRLAQAMSGGASTLSFALEYACEPGGTARGEVDPLRLDAIEASLSGVSARDQQPVLEQLSAFREKCGGR